MNSVTLAPAPEPVPTDAARFLERWHDDVNDLTCVVFKQGKLLNHTFGRIRDYVDLAIGNGFPHNDRVDTYHTVGTLKEAGTARARGGYKNVAQVPGIWADYDVKDGAFSSFEHAAEFLGTLPLRPTLCVSTGTGGLHAYWKFKEPLAPADAQQYMHMWHAYSQEQAGEILVDSVVSADHLMRTPGFVRWPKKLDEPPSVSRLLDYYGPLTDVREFLRVTHESWERTENRRQEVRSKLGRGAAAAMEMLRQSTHNPWLLLYGVAGIEDVMNERYTWHDILLPFAWYPTGAPSGGRTEWCHPGGVHSRTATTDWTDPRTGEVSQAMTLFSKDPRTGLADLWEAGVPLTKYRVLVQLGFGGDETALIRRWMESESL